MSAGTCALTPVVLRVECGGLCRCGPSGGGGGGERREQTTPHRPPPAAPPAAPDTAGACRTRAGARARSGCPCVRACARSRVVERRCNDDDAKARNTTSATARSMPERTRSVSRHAHALRAHHCTSVADASAPPGGVARRCRELPLPRQKSRRPPGAHGTVSSGGAGCDGGRSIGCWACHSRRGDENTTTDEMERAHALLARLRTCERGRLTDCPLAVPLCAAHAHRCGLWDCACAAARASKRSATNVKKHARRDVVCGAARAGRREGCRARAAWTLDCP